MEATDATTDDPSVSIAAAAVLVGDGIIHERVLREKSLCADVTAAVSVLPSTPADSGIKAYSSVALFALAASIVSGDGQSGVHDDNTVQWLWGNDDANDDPRSLFNTACPSMGHVQSRTLATDSHGCQGYASAREVATPVATSGAAVAPAAQLPMVAICEVIGLPWKSGVAIRQLSQDSCSRSQVDEMVANFLQGLHEDGESEAVRHMNNINLIWKLLVAATGRSSLASEEQSSRAQAKISTPFIYDARTRASFRLVASWLGLPWRNIAMLESTLAVAEANLVSAEAASGASDAVAERSPAAASANGGDIKSSPRASTWETSSAQLSSMFQRFRGSSAVQPAPADGGASGGAAATANAAAANIGTERKGMNWMRVAKISGAAVGGGVVLAVTGGLAAPALAAGIASAGAATGVGAVAAVTGVVATVSSNALIGTAFGAAGAHIMATKTARLTAGLQVFEFLPVKPQESQDGQDPPKLALTVCVSGFLGSSTGQEDYTKPWMPLVSDTDESFADSEVFAVKWEPKELTDLGNGLRKVVTQAAASMGASEIIKLTVLASVAAAVALPATLITAAGAIDNRWTVGLARARSCGTALAEWLMSRPLGARPTTLVGSSLGGSAVLQALECLAEAPNGRGLGLVERAVIMGSPVAPSQASWLAAASVCAHELVNVYSSNDFTLSVLFRSVKMSSILLRPVAGLAPVPEAVVAASTRKSIFRSVEVSDIIAGNHMLYQTPGHSERILERCGLSSS
eukprot:TRINITY_DN37137_c0_g1_i1.p1 TRINITY_DN37137_c0_g1~~TRINITY_DN37137_c0_g1_i1.p1  ORF type:complete len:762 (+),score=134.92 TRINITY_DN37137_c0_g1_i1:45-2288(+)